MQHRSILFVLSGAAQLLDCAQAVEAAAAAALDVPSPSPPLPDAAAADGAADDGAVKPASTADAEDVEAGKLSVALQPASSPAAAPAAAKRPSALKRLAANPYVSTFVVLLALASPLLMLAVLLKSCWTAARCLPALLRSREARRAGKPGGGTNGSRGPCSGCMASMHVSMRSRRAP